MRILAVNYQLPMPDRASGDLRFFSMLSMLAGEHQVAFWTSQSATGQQAEREGDLGRYTGLLEGAGIKVIVNGFVAALRSEDWDVVLIEFYNVASPLIPVIRFHSPTSRIVVDSVDVHFNRLLAKARVTGGQADMAEAEATKKDELATYNLADLVVAVSKDDCDIIARYLPGKPVRVLPNIHWMHASTPTSDQVPDSLVFVGGFGHRPNIDAVLYFVKDVLPLIRSRLPTINLTIVGNAPPPEVQALQGEGVRITGYVADTLPYLRASRVSIAPLRYGGGMKGKVGEAMAAGLPVVTTTIGAEGFGLTSWENVLVGDSPEEFADHVLRLLQDPVFYDRVRTAGWQFIADNYSYERVSEVVSHTFLEIGRLVPQASSLSTAVGRFFYDLGKGLRECYQRHIGWRFG